MLRKLPKIVTSLLIVIYLFLFLPPPAVNAACGTGVGSELYQYNGSTWSLASSGIPGILASGSTNSIETVQSITTFNGKLYVGTWKTGSAEVYSWDGVTWTKISQPTPGQIAAGGTTGITGVASMTVYNNELYIGTYTGSTLNERAEVYRYGGGTSWTKVSQSTPGQIAAGGNTGIQAVWTMIVFNSNLYVGTIKNHPDAFGVQVPFDGAEVYRYGGGTSWTKVSQATLGQIAAGGTTNIDVVAAMTVFNSSLYITTSDNTGIAEVYRYGGGTSWTKVTQPAAGQIAAGGTSGINKIPSIIVYNNNLYVGTEEGNSAEVYRYGGGTSWTKISSSVGVIMPGGTGAIDGAWSLAVYNNQLFVGTDEAPASFTPGACPPTADIKANGSDGPITIPFNTAATISWTSTDATSCIVSSPDDNWTGTNNSGISTVNLTATVTYTLNCSGPGGAASDSVRVDVSSPPVEPWIQITNGGDVGVKGSIDMATAPPGSNKNVPYVAIAEGGMILFESAKGWLVKNY